MICVGISYNLAIKKRAFSRKSYRNLISLTYTFHFTFPEVIQMICNVGHFPENFQLENKRKRTTHIKYTNHIHYRTNSIVHLYVSRKQIKYKINVP